MYFKPVMNAHVRWPDRPAEHRAGLDLFFVILRITYLHQGKKSKLGSQYSKISILRKSIWWLFDSSEEIAKVQGDSFI